jgi:hypothetical protein
MKALIGYTGFVGGNLAKQHDFDGLFNSRTIEQAIGQHFEILVCSAAPGAMFAANRDPERDREQIEQLMSQLSGINACKLILISTIAVLSGFSSQDETTQAFERDIPYGAHRRMLEEFAEAHFPYVLIVRLPALFGPGLKKNFLFDIMNPMPSMLPSSRIEALRKELGADLGAFVANLYVPDPILGLNVIDRSALEQSGRRAELETAAERAGFGAVQFTNRYSRFQFYDVSRLWNDINLGLDHDLRVLHLVPPPLRADEVYRRLTGRPMPSNAAPLHEEDTRTRHANLWGRTGHYIESASQTWQSLRLFFETQGRKL